MTEKAMTSERRAAATARCRCAHSRASHAYVSLRCALVGLHEQVQPASGNTLLWWTLVSRHALLPQA